MNIRRTLILIACTTLIACVVGEEEDAPRDEADDIAFASGSPTGNLEHVDVVMGGVSIRGWAFDPSTTDSIYVWITIDGVGQHVHASGSRPDVGDAYGGHSRSGFSKTIAAAAGTRRVCVTASNVGAGSHTSLGCKNVAVGVPFGSIDVFGMHSSTQVRIRGWAIDPDTRDSIYMWVTVNGSGRHISANQPRGDIGSIYPAYGGNHGFDSIISVGSGLQRVCVTASNVYGGSHKKFGCKDFGSSGGGIPDSGWTRPLGSYSVSQEYRGGSVHNGMDLTSPYGTLVRTARAGRIKAILRGSCKPGYSCANSLKNWRLDPVYQMSGDKVVLQHADGTLSIYDHCGVVSGRYLGQNIGVNTSICRINQTGNRTGPHLHFAIFATSSGYTPRNPRNYLSF